MLLKSATLPNILDATDRLQMTKDEVLLLLFAEQDVADIPALTEALNRKNIPFFGGIFPGIIYAKQSYSSGCVIKKFPALKKPFCVTGISDSTFEGLPAPDAALPQEEGTAIVLLDGLTPGIYGFLEKLNDLLGEKCQFIGGGAGSISLRQQPCVFCNRGFTQDSAVVCVIKKQVRLGVRHGWEQLAGPLVATKTDGNTIRELNWQPAIDIYNEIIEKHCGIRLDKENFAGIAQGYPFGILREMEDDIVRDPLAIGEGGSIICIGEVPANAVLHVLKGRPEKLLDAALRAVSDCSEKPGVPISADATFVVDCITRTLYLDGQFARELEIIENSMAIEQAEQEPFGILSLGEIASYYDGLLELFNKTIVIGTFYA